MSDQDFDPGYFDLERDGDVVVATFLATRLTEEDNVEQIGHELSALVDKLQHRRVVLNLESVQYATSSVIGKWIMLHRKLDREGGKLVVCGLQPGLADILSTSKLLNYFNVSTDSNQARAQCNVASA